MRNKILYIFKAIITIHFCCSFTFGDSVARIIKAEGVVYIKRLGMTTYAEVAQVGNSINNGDAIKVGDYGFAAVIFLDDRSVVKIKPNSQFEFMDTKNTRSLNLLF